MLLPDNNNPDEAGPLDTARSFAFAGSVINSIGEQDVIVAGGRGEGKE